MDQQVVQEQVAVPTPVPVTAEPDLASILNLPQPTQEPAPQPAVAQPPAQAPVPAPQPAPAPQPQHTVPLAEMLEQRHARQMAEREAQYVKEQLSQYQRAWEMQQRASQPPPQPIDPETDPRGAYEAMLNQNAALQRQMNEQAVHQRANMSEMLARREHGNEKVEQAVQAAIQAGLNRNFMSQPDPYAALMTWHNAQAIAGQVGPDLKAWEAKKEAEILAKYGIKPGTPPPAPAPAPQNLPPSLSAATRANTGVPVAHDPSTTFNAMFDRKKPQL